MLEVKSKMSMNMPNMYRIIDGDGERITREHYETINNVINNSFGLHRSVPSSGNTIINHYKFNDSSFFMVHYTKDETIFYPSHMKPKKEEFESKTKLMLEEID
jgi:hypothetical protein